jgi:hypothetical protein
MFDYLLIKAANERQQSFIQQAQRESKRKPVRTVSSVISKARSLRSLISAAPPEANYHKNCYSTASNLENLG